MKKLLSKIFKKRGKPPLKTAIPHPLQGGYWPIHGQLDESNPPKGGSGVPNK